MTRRFFVILCISFLFVSCSMFLHMKPDTPVEITKSEKGSWTLLIYMAADNNLESEAIEDIREMECSNLKTKNINILVLVDRHPSYDISNGNWSGTKLYKIKTGRQIEERNIISEELSCESLGLNKNSTEKELDMSSGHTLSAFISYGFEKFPAEHMGLFIWGHGTGWRSSEETTNRAFAFDSTSGTYMTLKQLHNSLSDCLSSKHFDLIGFDTCFGAELEVIYELKDFADYIIGSPGLLVSAGWNYENLFNDFNLKQQKSTEELCKSIISQFQNQYAHKNGASIISINTKKIGDFMQTFNNYMKAAAANISSIEIRDELIHNIFINCIHYTEGSAGSDVYLDLMSLNTTIKTTFEKFQINFEKHYNLLLLSCSDITQTAWSSEIKNPGPGIYFATLAEGGIYAAKHPAGYIKGAASDQIDFVTEDLWYVPTKSRNLSFMDKIFYCTQWQ